MANMNHHCDNLVITCIDFRFQNIFNDFVNSLKKCDRVSIAGSSKSLVDEDTCKSVLKQIDISIRLHKINKIILLEHEDCGAYGGKAAVTNDQEEISQHSQLCVLANNLIKKHYPKLKVAFFYAKLDGNIIDL